MCGDCVTMVNYTLVGLLLYHHAIHMERYLFLSETSKLLLRLRC